MKKLDIVFGCFDFIVTPNDEYYFLEVNEQGQFLWIEDVNPEIKMLNVMRVMGVTLLSAKNIHVPIGKIVPAVDFPTTTDRNKALLIISSLVNNRTYAKYVSNHCSGELIAELKLQQPNVHDLAYMILKTISGKKYSDRDYKSWELWLKNNRN